MYIQFRWTGFSPIIKFAFKLEANEKYPRVFCVFTFAKQIEMKSA